MVARGKSVRGSLAALKYMDDDGGSAVLLVRNHCPGDGPDQWRRSMQAYEGPNRGRSANLEFVLVLSPSKEANAALMASGNPEAAYARLAWDFLARLEEEHRRMAAYFRSEACTARNRAFTPLVPGDHPFVAELHRSTDDAHIHIVMSRSSVTGAFASDRFFGRAAGKAADALALDYGLRTAREVRDSKISEIRGLLDASRAEDFPSLQRYMNDGGYDFQLFVRPGGEPFGAKVTAIADRNPRPPSADGGKLKDTERLLPLTEGYKLSKIGKGYSLGALEARMAANRAARLRAEREAAAEMARPAHGEVPGCADSPEAFDLARYTPRGALEKIPKHIIGMMLENQVRSGNPQDIGVFERDRRADREGGGFDWIGDPERGAAFWDSVLGPGPGLPPAGVPPDPVRGPGAEEAENAEQGRYNGMSR